MDRDGDAGLLIASRGLVEIEYNHSIIDMEVAAHRHKRGITAAEHKPRSRQCD